ncbi:MAG: cupin domain-containing protein [Nitrospiria bacterium]
MDRVDQRKVKANWRLRGFSCDIWTDPPQQIWSNYIHEVDERVMLLEGEIELSFEGKAIHPKIGEEVLVPARVRHTVINISKGTNRWFYGYKKS